MFSRRIQESLQPNHLAQRLAARRAAGHAIIDLTESNPTRVGLIFPPEILVQAWAASALQPYAPDPHGPEEARGALARYYRLQGQTLDPRSLFLTAGTSEAYAMLFKLLADPGDEVLIPRPGYPLLEYLAAFEGLQGVFYPLGYHAEQGWRIDLEVLSALVTPRTRAVVAVNPNNPTGSFLKRDELRFLDDLCRSRQIALIVDEVFADYAVGSDPRRVTSVAGHTRCLSFALNGFSKLLALPQVKLAWIALGGEPAMVQAAAERLETLLDFYLTVSTPVQHAAATLLTGREAIQAQVRTRLAVNRKALQARTAQTENCRVLGCEGGWYAIVEIDDDVTDTARALIALERADTLIHPGYFYEFSKEGCVVISLLPETETFRSGIERLLGLFGRCARG